MNKIAHFPKHVKVRVNHPSPEGLAVDLCFRMSRKNDFHYMVFANAQGVAEADGEQLLKTFDEERGAFLMDYADPRNDFTGEIVGRVLHPQDLESATKAFHMYREHLAYPPDYELKLNRAMERDSLNAECSVETVL